jgi:hypothetical protein
MYGWLGQKRIVFVLSEVERAKRSHKSEDIALPSKLEVEHIMPQSWHEHGRYPTTPSLCNNATRTSTCWAT